MYLCSYVQNGKNYFAWDNFTPSIFIVEILLIKNTRITEIPQRIAA